jgi:hypothetical protein
LFISAEPTAMHSNLIRTYDYSGNLKQGYFYELEIPLGCDLDLPERKNPENIVFTLPEFVQTCTREKTHGDSRITEYGADLFGGDFAPKCICGGLAVLVNRKFRDELLASDLKGFSATSLPITCNQSEMLDPEIYILNFLGQDCRRMHEILIPPKNACPFCGRGPIVCPECLNIEYECEECKKTVTALPREHQGVSDPRFIIEIPSNGWVIEVGVWDGSDFIATPTYGASGIITRRALNFLISMKAFPLIAKPCHANLLGCDEQQLKRLDSIRHHGSR